MVAALAAASMGFVDARQQVAQIAKSADGSGKSAVAGKGGWYYFVPELKHLSGGKFWGVGGNRDPLPAIVDFNAQCRKAGVELILVPVPGKAAIYPQYILGGSGSGLDAMDQQFLRTLRSQGVKVLDLTGKFRSAGGGTPVFCKQDTHWSGTGVSLAADAIASELKRRPWYGGVSKSRYAVRPANVSAKGDLGEMAGARGAESIRVFKVSGNVSPSRTSPVVLLGDSHNLIFSAGGDMITTGAGLPENLSAKLGFPVDLVAVRGSGATPARINLARRRDNLRGKKVVVWCFTTREFTEGQGWRKVPVVR
jgi:alginate O-acetyltransferase complex protein AlgJ